MLKLVKGGRVYAPEEIGAKDILIAGDKILKIAEKIAPPEGLETEIIDASGKKVIPGLIDGHVHFNGAGGGFGYDSRSFPTPLINFVEAGVTTCVGCMGIDKVGFSLEGLLARAKALEIGGISAYMLSGSYTLPSNTITGSLMRDLYLIDKVIGVKIALWETIASHPSEEMLIAAISETILGGRMGNKAGVIVSHLGDVKCRPVDIPDLLDRLGAPNESFVMTHVNREPELLAQTVECGKRGIILDLTATVHNETKIQPSKALRILLDSGVLLENITMSSDSSIGTPIFMNGERCSLFINACLHEIQDMVKNEGFSLTDALKTMTSNPARVYKLEQKGRITEGKDADIVLMDENLEIDTVLSRGKVMLRGKQMVQQSMLAGQMF